MEKKYKNCQSCGMPLKKDSKGGGTELDGSKSKIFCSFCYENSEFIDKEISLEQMQVKVTSKMEEMGFPAFLSVYFSKSLPKLLRWK